MANQVLHQPVDTSRASAAGTASRRRRDERRVAYLFAGPLFVIFALFYLWPTVTTVASSFFRWGLLNPWSIAEPDEWRFAGLGNYTDVLTDGAFWNAALNTALWLVAFPVLVTVLGLFVSLLIYEAPAGGSLPVSYTHLTLPTIYSV